MKIDILVIVIYFIFMMAIGYFFQKHASNSTNDYFSGGGKMLWWMVGGTAFMTQFSAMTFTGMAGDAFAKGIGPVVVFYANALGYLTCFLWFAPKARQLRIATPIEGIRMRFGNTSEQVFTWAIMLPNIISAGVWLNALAIFASAVFEVSIDITILVTGLVVLFMSLTGGAWAVIASDFMQMIILMVGTVACALVASIKGGGFFNILNLGLPANKIVGPNINYVWLFTIWFIMIFCKQFFSVSSLTGGAYRFFSAKDTKNARKGALLALGLMLIGPLVWFLPVWYMSAFNPDVTTWGLSTLGKSITNGVYLAFIKKEMPAGMAGIMMSGIFAATMSSMDSALNRNAGIVIKSFYCPIVNKNATEKQMMTVSKIVTFFFGVMIISIALLLNKFNNLSLFTITLMIGTLLDLPILIPGLLGYVVKKTPDWAGWATVLVGFMVSFSVMKLYNPTWVANALSLAVPFTTREAKDMELIVGLGAQFTITCGFFMSTKLFFKGFKSKAREESYNKFFNNITTEVIAIETGENELDNTQRGILGKLIFAFGIILSMLVVIPNPIFGRVTLFLIGLTNATIGYFLNRASKPKKESKSEVVFGKNGGVLIND